MKLKRTAAALTAAAMLPLCACQSAPPQVQLDPSSPTAIEIWHYYNGAQKEAFDSLVTEFNETWAAKGHCGGGFLPGQCERRSRR
ncbi:MAG: hypothetical protein ACLRQY_02920 [[Clostridium] leptum]